jgi:uroporphyrinogen decarboxylase
MNRKERVNTTFEHREPDIVPITEMAIDTPILEAVAGRQFSGPVSLQAQLSANRERELSKVEMTVRTYDRLDFDIVFCDLSAPDNWEAKANSDGTMTDEWGRILTFDSQCKAWVPFRSQFSTPEDVEGFSFPDSNAPGRTFALEHTKRLAGEDTAVAAFIRDPFAHVWEMFQVNNFVRWMYERPSIIRNTIEKMTRFNIDIIGRVADAGVDFIVSGGDYSEKNGPMVPVKFFREVIFPSLSRQADAAHKTGLKFVKHSDGNLNPLLEDLSRIVDGLQSLDPTAGMDIGAVKAKYGDKLVLMGNVAVDTLTFGSRREVVEETKACIRRAAPGGGYILSSSNSWYGGANLENCLAMVEAGREYGRYPIRID